MTILVVDPDGLFIRVHCKRIEYCQCSIEEMMVFIEILCNMTWSTLYIVLIKAWIIGNTFINMARGRLLGPVGIFSWPANNWFLKVLGIQSVSFLVCSYQNRCCEPYTVMMF